MQQSLVWKASMLERNIVRHVFRTSDLNEIKLREDAAVDFGEGGSPDARPTREREGIPTKQTDGITT